MDGIIAKRMPVTRQLNYLYEALSGAIEFGSPYMIMDKIKTALEEKNDGKFDYTGKEELTWSK